MIPNSRKTLIEYCLRNLGHPVIKINVDPEQVDDRIDEALQLFQEFHFEATQRIYVKHILTDEDITNKWIDISQINPRIISIVRMFPINDFTGQRGGAEYLFSIPYALTSDAIRNISGPGGSDALISYDITMKHLSQLRFMFSSRPMVEYQKHMDRLYIYMNWEQVRPGSFIILECVATIDPEEYAKVWNDSWLKRYATALIKRCWGSNLKKYEGVQGIGGITLNGQSIFDEANSDILELKEELKTALQEPPVFFVG